MDRDSWQYTGGSDQDHPQGGKKKKYKEKAIIILKRYLYFHVHCSITYNSQDMETSYVSTDRWMDKQNVYTKGTSLLVLWLWLHLPVQGMKVQFLVRELDPQAS